MFESDKYRIVSEIKFGFILYLEWRKGLYIGLKIMVDVILILFFDDFKEVDMNYIIYFWKVFFKVKDCSDYVKSVIILYFVLKFVLIFILRFNENVFWCIFMLKFEIKIF